MGSLRCAHTRDDLGYGYLALRAQYASDAALWARFAARIRATIFVLLA